MPSGKKEKDIRYRHIKEKKDYERIDIKRNKQ